uniref:Uncharacterized protein n=1 Tax=Anopheles atroparvus TaxID=41427 RepID=A0AAG5DRF5_ANOAO
MVKQLLQTQCNDAMRIKKNTFLIRLFQWTTKKGIICYLFKRTEI